MAEPNFVRVGDLPVMTTAQVLEFLQPCQLAFDTTKGKIVYKTTAGVVKDIQDVTSGEAYIDATELATTLSVYQTKALNDLAYDPKRTYKIYRALITQSSTDAPTVVVLQNELSAAIVWTRDSAGLYYGTLAGAFTENKTFGFCSIADVTAGVASVSRATGNTVALQTAQYSDHTKIDGLLNNASLEILVHN